MCAAEVVSDVEIIGALVDAEFIAKGWAGQQPVQALRDTRLAMPRSWMKRRTEITIERHCILAVSSRRVSIIARCATCEAQTRMVTVDEAANICGVSARTIYRRVEAGELHWTEMPEGRLLVCSNSLG